MALESPCLWLSETSISSTSRGNGLHGSNSRISIASCRDDGETNTCCTNLNNLNNTQGGASKKTPMEILSMSQTKVLLVLYQTKDHPAIAIYVVISLYDISRANQVAWNRRLLWPAAIIPISGDSSSLQILKHMIAFVFQVYWSTGERDEMERFVGAVNQTVVLYDQRGGDLEPNRDGDQDINNNNNNNNYGVNRQINNLIRDGIRMVGHSGLLVQSGGVVI